MGELILIGILAILAIFLGLKWFATYVSTLAYICYTTEKGYKQPTREELTAYKTIIMKDMLGKK